MRKWYRFSLILLIAGGCSHSFLVQKVPVAAAPIVGPAVVELVSTFRKCSGLAKKQVPATTAEIGGRYDILFDLTLGNSRVASFSVKKETLPQTSKAVIESCSTLAVSQADKTLLETIQDPKYERFVNLNSEHAVIVRGVMVPQPNATIMSESGQILLELPTPGMDWK